MTRAGIIIFLVLVALTMALARVPWHLDDYDEAKQAFTSFEMLHDGAWCYQHSPDGHLATKPPFTGWLSAAVYILLRNWNLAWRLPSFAAWALLAGLVYSTARRNTSTTAALMAMSALSLNILNLRLATLVRTDMLLALFSGICGLLTLRVLTEQRDWHRGEKWGYAISLMAALMTKGPVVYLFILPGPLLYYWLVRPTPRWNRIWPGLLPVLGPMLPFLSWVLGGILTQPGFLDEVVINEFLARLETGAEAVHISRPLWFYVGPFLLKTLPWSGFLIYLVCNRTRRIQTSSRVEFRFSLFWLAGSFVVMSLIPSKRIDRIFPLIVPLSLMLGYLWPENWKRLSPAIAWATLLVFGSYTAVQINTGYRNNSAGLVTFGRQAADWAQQHGVELVVETHCAHATGMNLYANTTESATVDEVVCQKQRGQPVGMILDSRQLDHSLEQLHHFEVIMSSTNYGGREHMHYLLADPNNANPPGLLKPVHGADTTTHSHTGVSPIF